MRGEDVRHVLDQARMIFWDFDGVIKESVAVKTRAFVELFRRYGEDVAERVGRHHEANGGMSRFQKIPLYLGWAEECVTAELIDEYCHRFSREVLQAVIDSPWVPGVREYLLSHCEHQYFVLVTGTPQKEIEDILAVLDIARCFRECHGAPAGKTEVIRDVLYRTGYQPGQALFIGDSATDVEAATETGVPFLLRCTPLNGELQRKCQGRTFQGLDQAWTD